MIRNLTPHKVAVFDRNDDIIAEYLSEGVARAVERTVPDGEIDGVPVVISTFGQPVDLPEPEDGVMLIVSLITAQSAKQHGRITSDLLLTSSLIRDAAGQIIGCRRFSRFI